MAIEKTSMRIPALGEALDNASMSRLHVRFWLLAGLGILLDGFDFFIIGVANPLITKDFNVGPAEKGLVSAAAIVGAIFGAGMLGQLGDRIGRSRIFRVDLWLFVIFSVACIFASRRHRTPRHPALEVESCYPADPATSTPLRALVER